MFIKLRLILFLLCLFAGNVAWADVAVQIDGPAGKANQTLAGSGGVFGLNLPLAKNAVNKITVSASDEYGNEASRELLITQISFDSLVAAEVKAEPLSVERIEQLVREGVIDLDNPANYNVSQFDIVLTIGSQTVPVSVPIAVPKNEPEPTGWETYQMPTGDGGSGGKPPPPPIEIIVFQEFIEAVVPGQPAPPPIPGVIIIEGRIKSLKEFFSVKLLMMNLSGIFTLADVTANLEFPNGGLSKVLPADGIASLGSILPGNGTVPGQKEKEFIVRGDELGIRGIKVNFGGKVAGPGIPEGAEIAFNGSAQTSVEVKGPPTFLVQVIHPDIVEKDTPYELLVDVTNTGQTPALYASLELDVGAAGSLVSCTVDAGSAPQCTNVESPEKRPFGHIYPAQTVRESFTIIPDKSGSISSCLGIADQNITLQVLVGAIGCLVGNFPPERKNADGLPSVSVLPAPNMLGVGLAAPVTAFFTKKMNEVSLRTGSGGTFNVYDENEQIVPGVITLETLADKTVAIWQPAAGKFPPNAEFSVWLGRGIVDRDGFALASEWNSKFTTTGEALNDVAPPEISLVVMPPVNPHGVIPGQKVSISAYASDQGSGIARVELRKKDLDVAGASYELIDQKNTLQGDLPPFNFILDSSNLTYGHTYQLLGTALDAMGNARDTTLALVVLPNAAPPTIALPADNSAGSLRGVGLTIVPTQITGGVTEVRYYLDSAAAPFQTVNLSPYCASLATINLPLGEHTIRAVVADGLGQTGVDSYAFNLLENTNAPAVAISNPPAGAQFVRGNIFAVTGSAEDPTGIKSIKFFLDSTSGTPAAENVTSFPVNTASLSLGQHTVYIVASNNIDLSNSPAIPEAARTFSVINPPPEPAPGAPQVSSLSYPQNGQVTLSGSTQGSARVDITNVTLGVALSVYAGVNGVFSASIDAEAGNQLEFVAYDPSQTNQSPKTILTVQAAPMLDYISVLPSLLKFNSFGSYQDLTVTAHYLGGQTADVTAQSSFVSSNVSVASAGSNGRVVAQSNGQAQITVHYSGKLAEAAVTVNVVVLTSISLSPAPLEFTAVNQTQQLAVTGHYSDGSTQLLAGGNVFTTGNPAIASVSSSGLVTANGAGTTQITASRAGLPPASATVAVDLGLDTPPTATILSPAGGTDYERGDIVLVSVRAEDQVGGINKIVLETSGAFTYSETRQVAGLAVTTQQFTFTVPVDAPVGAALNISAYAEDTAGAISPAAVTSVDLLDKTPPAVTITAPAQETEYNFGDTVTLNVSASDAVGVTQIRWAASGALTLSGAQNTTGGATENAVFTFTLPFGLTNPDVALRAWAIDQAGNEREATAVDIVITDADITPPATIATAVSNPDSSAAKTVTYQVTDGLADLDHVELFFRRNGIGTFNRFTDAANGNPEGKFTPQSGAAGTILFDSTRMGGDGVYEFYTVGVDAAGNREADPKDGTNAILPDQSATFSAGQPVTVISTPTVIGEGDLTYDNLNLRITAATVTVSGSHSFHNIELLNGAKLIHPETTLTTEYGVDFSAWTLSIDASSSIDASARGYLGGNHGGNACAGQTAPGISGSTERSGGSYGGTGAKTSGTPNLTYGSLVSPAELGSGGSCGGGYGGGDGGGRVVIRAINIISDGSIKANGQNGDGNDAGSGSGGAINLAVATLSGEGTVEANGGAYQLGGGGGRIAVNYVDITTLDTALLKALGGRGSAGAGGNGTVFLRGLSDTNGTLVVDGQGTATSFSPLPIAPGYVFDNIVLQNSARVVADDPLIVSDTFEIKSNSILTHSRGQEDGLQIQAAHVIVDSTSSIDVLGKGYRGGLRDGRSVCPGETLGGLDGATERSGGSYGGLGGQPSGRTNPAYGTVENPVYLGAGGSCGGGYTGGNGGGRIDISASRTIVIAGALNANGQAGSGNDAGSGAGGSIKLVSSLLKGSGVISADGGAYQVSGGGGRIALFYDYLGDAGADFSSLRNVHASGGHAGTPGSAGTLLAKRSSQTYGDLYFDELLASGTSARWSPLTHVGFGKTLAVSSDDTTTTITTDGTVALPPKGLIGLAFNPDTNQQQTFTILDNTATTITIPKTPVAAVNAEYSALYRFDNVFLRRGAWVVLGDKLLVQTKLQLAERSVLTHYDATPVFSSRLELEAGSIEITADSSINASQRGYPGGLHEGNISCTAVSAPGVTGAQQRSGGSYGGLGYPESGAPNAVYGNITEPKHLGSGGSCGGGYFGGDGGGSVQVVAGSLVVDGLIAADGQTGEGNDAGSGAGGSINIRAVSFTGSGTVRANGGAYQVGGGGGRVAMRYQTLGLGAAQIQAIGGQVSGTRDGGAGTLFLKHDSEPDGELIIDGQGNAPVANLSIIPDGYTFDRITLRNKAYAVADYPLQVNGAVSLLGESLLTHTTRRENGLAIQAASMFVDATSSINVQGRGYLGGYVTGNSSCNGETISGQPGSQERSGGSYGGLGFTQSGAGPNATYGDPRNPVEIGSGGSCGGGYAGGNGGGRVNISASGTVQIDGLVTADGNPGSGNNAGSGSGGAVKIAAGTLSGNGRITANGGGYQLGAGGGRVAVRYGTLDFDTSRFEVKGGQAGNENGGNGTLYLKSSAQANGDLIIDGLNTDTPVNLSPIPGGYTFDNITLRNKARVTADSMLKVAGTLTLSAGSLLTHTRGLESGITIRTLDLVVDASSKIDATGRGYLGGCRGALGTRGETLGGLAGARERSGASYGGLGFNLSGATNPAYGTPQEPIYLGSGGSCGGGYAGGNGGGRIDIEATGSVRVDGVIAADGDSGTGNDSGSGSGGSIWLRAAQLRGSGSIHANGGAYHVPGGGGRIAVNYVFLGASGDNFAELRNVLARGGHNGTRSASAGTVLFKQIGQQCGDLYFDEELASGTSVHYSPLTHTGFGTIAGVTSDATTTTITTDGLVEMLPGALVGLQFNPDTSQTTTFPVLANTEDTITIAQTPLAQPGGSYSGVYCFDNVTLRRGAFVIFGDQVDVTGQMLISENSVLTHYDARYSGFTSRLEVNAGALQVLSGSSINVDGRGYVGGCQDGNGATGQTIPGLTGSTERSGGSYGGRGGNQSGVSNFTYGSPVNPNELGSGGSCGGGYGGGDGGGLIKLSAGSLVVDGTISANGNSGDGNTAGSGAGGGIKILANALSGAGTIRADGGAYQLGGGGGRVYTAISSTNSFSGTITASGGIASGPDGVDGTVVIE